MSFMSEFKEFALKGNVVDMAVGVIIGGAFGGIVGALTDDFINPLIASIGGAEVAGAIRLPWVDYTGLDSEAVMSLSLNYGHFITQIINFLILALILFMIIKGMNKLMSIGKKEEEPAADPEPSDEVKLLTEIRDALASK
ncbi:MAG: large conductance mechanosensitive channel protein MscL [Clostridiales bacterium]|nr:large conductance mechanosensitive channel protein MscL [Clostridiales bacterium]MBR6483895.1 large conductance mechanosensitive channel protein MscL [Clostridiales bacterium]